jgi:hypothetical protein
MTRAGAFLWERRHPAGASQPPPSSLPTNIFPTSCTIPIEKYRQFTAKTDANYRNIFFAKVRVL